MWQYLRKCLLLISLVLLIAGSAKAQTLYPARVGDKVRCAFIIETPKAYLSGICILYHAEENVVRGSLFNEFGISALDFSYAIDKDKVKLHHVIKVMNKWYLRRVLKHDLRELMHCIQGDVGKYINEKYHLSYELTLLDNNRTQSNDAIQE